METKTIHKSNISFVEVLAALVEFFTLCTLFLIQGTAKTARTAGRYARIALALTRTTSGCKNQ